MSSPRMQPIFDDLSPPAYDWALIIFGALFFAYAVSILHECFSLIRKSRDESERETDQE